MSVNKVRSYVFIGFKGVSLVLEGFYYWWRCRAVTYLKGTYWAHSDDVNVEVFWILGDYQSWLISVMSLPCQADLEAVTLSWRFLPQIFDSQQGIIGGGLVKLIKQVIILIKITSLRLPKSHGGLLLTDFQFKDGLWDGGSLKNSENSQSKDTLMTIFNDFLWRDEEHGWTWLILNEFIIIAAVSNIHFSLFIVEVLVLAVR